MKGTKGRCDFMKKVREVDKLLIQDVGEQVLWRIKGHLRGCSGK